VIQVAITLQSYYNRTATKWLQDNRTAIKL
jgi:hypothetical protein